MSDLQGLSDAWQRFGCAICGTTVQTRSEQGWREELHHIIPRARGGGDEPENLMGLCGELLPNKCHWKVTNNIIKISWDEYLGSWIWTDTRSGEEGICRTLTADVIKDLNLDRRLPETAVLPQNSATSIPAEYLPSPLHAEAGVLPAQERFHAITELVVRAERTMMALALLVQAAISLEDHSVLGFEDVNAWSEAAGISKGSLSKLRTVARQFQGRWIDLPEQDRNNISFEGLYYAARMVRMGVWDAEQALHEAVAKTATQLWQECRDAQNADRIHCVCPTCGVAHFHLPEQSEEQRQIEEATL